MNNQRIFFKNLDSIRFVAAMMVFLNHAVTPCFDFLPIKNTFWEKILNIICDGGIGVSIFFVLSGFLITYLLISENETSKRISLKNFYARRVLRIWPLYFAVIAFTFGVFPLAKILSGGNSEIGGNFFLHATFLSNFDVINLQHANEFITSSKNITWSVSVEEQFYLFWPLIFAFVPRKAWIYFILLSIFGSLLFRMLHSKDEAVLYFHTLSVLQDLGVGAAFAFMIKSSKTIRIIFENSSVYFHLFLFLVIIFLIYFEETIFNFTYGAALGRLVASSIFGVIICAQALTKKDSRLNLSKLKVANKWGKYTYGIYLIHPIAITLVVISAKLLHFKLNGFWPHFLSAFLSLILTLLLSRLSYDYFESKFLKLKDKFR